MIQVQQTKELGRKASAGKFIDHQSEWRFSETIHDMCQLDDTPQRLNISF